MRFHHSARLPALAAGTLLCSLPVAADVWHHAVTAPFTGEYDSNPAMATANEKSVWRAKFSPSYTLTRTSGADEFKAGLVLNLERSSDESLSASRQDPGLLLGWQRQTETGEFGLLARYDEASTRVTELDESGLLAVDGTRVTRSLAGKWRTALGERSSLAADAAYKNVSFDGGSLIDYTNLAGGVTYSYALSERVEPFMRATASHNDPDAVRSSSNYYSALGGLKWKATERLDWTVQAGVGRTTGNNGDSGWQGGLGLHYAIPRGELTLDVGRTVNPSSEGGFAESDQVKGSWGYAIDERTRSGIDATWRDYKGTTPSTTQQLGAWLNRELTPFWNARLSYRYKLRQQDGQPDASSNLLGLTLIYTHPDL